MSNRGIQGQVLEVTVVGCQKLKDTEWISRQDPYVCLDYGGTKFRTRTCTDGGKNPTFQEKFMFTLIEGLRELKVVVWNSNTLSTDDFIGNGTIQLHKVLSQGYEDCTWTLQTKTGRYAGEVRVIMHYAGAKKQEHASAPTAPPYAPQVPHAPLYSTPLPAAAAPPHHYASAPPHYAGSSGYPAYPESPYPPPPSSYPPPPSSYPPPHSAYPPPHSAYPPPHSAYPPPHSAYPPPPSTTYPPPSYPHIPQTYPYNAPGPYPGQYPPPPY